MKIDSDFGRARFAERDTSGKANDRANQIERLLRWADRGGLVGRGHCYPLFFNFYSNRVFEASKVTLLRSIALVMLGAWLIKILETWLSNREQGAQGNGQKSLAFLRTPLVIPALFLMAVYVLTTISSVVPQVSFLGSYHRRQGAYVVLCYIAIFF